MIEQTHVILVVILGFLAMLLMAGFLVTFILMYQRRQINQAKALNEVQRNYQKSLLETALESEEAERRRMAGELHDDIGVMLSLTKMSVNQLVQKLEGREEELELVLRVRGLLDETVTHVRRISKALVPSTLERFGLEASIEDLISKVAPSGLPRIVFTVSDEGVPRQSPKAELALFRVVQELINNAIKHAQATEIKIESYCVSGMIRLVVEDNGVGFDVEKAKTNKASGLGLRNIETRLSVIGGIAEYKSLDPGTRITIIAPLSIAE